MIFKNRTFYISLVVSLLSFLVCLALLCPSLKAVSYEAQGNVVGTQGVEEIVFWYDCDVTPSGDITITGIDPHINFEIPQCSSVTMNFEKGNNMGLYVFYSSDGAFTEEQKILVNDFSQGNHITFPMDETARHIRIDFSQDFKFKSIELNDAKPISKPYRIPISSKRYVLAVLGALIIGALVWVLDKKTKLFETLFAKIKVARKNALVLIVGGILMGGISYLLELLYSHNFAQYKDFSFGRCVFMAAVLFLTFAFVYLFKQLKEKPEIFVALSIFALGVVIILGQPFAHNSWDIDSHYAWAHNASFIGTSYNSNSDLSITGVSQDFYVTTDYFKEKATIEKLNQNDEIIVSTQSASAMISHRPSGIFIAIARLFGASFYQKYLFGELANVILYALLCYFGMRRLKSGKMLYAVIALFPTNLFLAANYSYDYWVIAFTMLGMAYFIGELQRPEEPISIKNTIIMCGAMALGSLPKLTYVFLLLVPLFMKKKGMEKTDKKKYYGICVAFIIVFFILLAIRAFSSATGSGDSRGGSEVNAFEQVKYILGNPLEYAKTLFNFLRGYLSIRGSQGYIANFAYLGIGTGYLVFVVLMAITAFTDKNEYDAKATNWLYRFLAVLLFIGVSIVVSTALYISFTAVGSSTVLGCQPRYIIPLIYPLLSLIGPARLNNKLNRYVYNSAVLIPVIILCFINIWNVIITYC